MGLPFHIIILTSRMEDIEQYVEPIKYVSDTISTLSVLKRLLYKLISGPWVDAGEIGRSLDSTVIQ
jgi:hypothetical protein